MCNYCGCRIHPPGCPNAPEPVSTGTCAHCAGDIYLHQDRCELPSGALLHSKCLIKWVEHLDGDELRKLFRRDNFDGEDSFEEWYENLGEEQIIEILNAGAIPGEDDYE